MRKSQFSILLSGSMIATLLLSSSCTQTKWTESEKESYRLVTQQGGATLGYSPASGVNLLTVDGFAFKDLNRNGQLDPYEDWRLTPEERAKDLASKISVEEIAGLMLYSAHQSIPGASQGFGSSTYNGKSFAESGALPSDLSDAQRKFLTEDNVRHVLVTRVQSPEVAALWNNNVQALVEGMGHGIPANNSSDPRHGTSADAEYNFGSGGQISLWPGSLGLAATFDPAVVKRFGEIASIEYRALGIATALSPQIDIATDPRWSRVSGTFGEDPDLSTDMARAYTDGFQTSSGDKEISNGWGYESVNAMVKHWPGGGSGEGGRDGHYGYGKYAVFPGNNLEQHKQPFIKGAFNLEGKTAKASAVMPYYTISVGQDPSGNDIANGYSDYLITDQLRGKYGYDGVVCTDWGITGDETGVETFAGKPWGAEGLTVAERHYRILMAGVDQFGGNNDKDPVLEAYQMGVKEYGEEAMRKRFEKSGERLLLNIFRTGLFENAYLDPAESQALVGKPEFMQEAYEAQLKSIVMVKNKTNTLPIEKNKKVYVPQRFFPPVMNFFGVAATGRMDYPVNLDLVRKYYTVVENPDEADFAIVFVTNPKSGSGYDKADADKGGNGYVPISLQFNDYTATSARNPSLAGGDPFEKFTNRSYKGKSVKTSNKTDMQSVNETKAKMKGKPVIVSMDMDNPSVMSEFEKSADAILINFGVQNQAVLDIISGTNEPSALLPIQMPADMRTVEEQFEDVPRDMRCHTDSEGNTYDFAFGMNWSGVINDARVSKYK
ncbi:glycoside hydrolase family 3 N-terminal domain-containing protein [Parabacteroides sp. PF5-9]|uniref:glycoside hydrolase family 3 protein n=1 Tax=Parabacteroides sp. PF5-9 TaxID=1742404 RepID=UPI002473DDD7|nr:glycoside hydrolase family 3 N-terminal domain-containing protein [Parabacteroides sp. PF5-9]MDH6359259.1 beta-glucosidase [Parabacteroides sp. PF5-9]